MRSDLMSRIQMKWGKFSKQQLMGMKGDLEQLVGMIQRAYGYSKKHAEREFHDFQLTLRPALHPAVVKAQNEKA